MRTVCCVWISVLIVSYIYPITMNLHITRVYCIKLVLISEFWETLPESTNQPQCGVGLKRSLSADFLWYAKHCWELYHYVCDIGSKYTPPTFCFEINVVMSKIKQIFVFSIESHILFTCIRALGIFLGHMQQYSKFDHNAYPRAQMLKGANIDSHYFLNQEF